MQQPQLNNLKVNSGTTKLTDSLQEPSQPEDCGVFHWLNYLHPLHASYRHPLSSCNL